MGSAMRRFLAALCIAGAGELMLAPGVLAASAVPGGLAAPELPPLPSEGPQSSAGAVVNDPGSPLQWGLDRIGAADGWSVATGNGITIAIVDSGADVDHEDLRDRIAGTATCLNTDGDPHKCTEGEAPDDNGHGSHVAGVAAATRDNGKGISGVAPDADLLIVKVLQQHCTVPTTPVTGGPIECRPEGTAADVAAGIRYAADQGAQVINLSVGSITQSLLGPSFSDALHYAWSKGAIPVVAAGNDGGSSGFTTEPALVVTAINRNDDLADKANTVGPAQWGIAAPGGEEDTQESCQSEPNGILSTYWVQGQTNAYACLPGTSAAAPHVAGAAAILLSTGLTPQQTVDRLLATADDVGQPGRDDTFGAGVVDVRRAVGAGPSTTATQPAPSNSATSAAPTTVTEPPTAVTPAPTTTPAVPPTIQLGEPQATGPSSSEQLSNQRNANEGFPTTPVIAAVLLAVTIGCACGWLAMRGAGWARRTPPS